MWKWKRDENKQIVKNEESGLPVLLFVSILRKTDQEWAIPGGMVDAGEEC